METLRLLLLLQFAALLYLIYRVHRLEQLVNGRIRTTPRLTQRSGRAGKVVPLLRDDIPPGPFSPGTPDRDDRS
ncbi:hypothetical protein [Symbiobacterium thermophilum]|uniref:Uncharacterized protein n=1 Tax=Symbiobacterium thermophilum TaxID=2734 RepID=A0A953I7C7_SYMTR|nr:hypothetical protein [Symbiobacterium thermophilum]MBY6274961.1 hypothetical protein [Symbiobacterium thermophilum]